MSKLPAYVAAHPLSIAKPVPITVGQLIDAIDKFKGEWEDMYASHGAILYYGASEIVGRVQAGQITPLDDATAIAGWRGAVVPVTRAVLYYLFAICIREMRHGSATMCDNAFGVDRDAWTPAQRAVAFACSTGDYDSFRVPQVQKAFADLPAADLFEAMERHFRKGKWKAAYGGAKWADIAVVALQYFRGEMSALMAVDRCWTLQHNTASIFNKSFFWSLDSYALHNVLNTQAKGSVLPLVNSLTIRPEAKDFKFLMYTTGAQDVAQADEPAKATYTAAAHLPPVWAGLTQLKQGARE